MESKVSFNEEGYVAVIEVAANSPLEEKLVLEVFKDKQEDFLVNISTEHSGGRGFPIIAVPVSIFEEMSELLKNLSLMKRVNELEEQLKTTASELQGMIDSENKRLKSNICSADLDDPSWIDYQTVHEAFSLLNNAQHDGD